MPAMQIFVEYTTLMDRVADLFGASHSLMHVHAGLAIYVGTQLMLQTRRASMTALNTVIAAAVGHEVLDYLGSANWDAVDTLQDIGLTVMWPVAITAVGQFRRFRWKQEQRELAQLYRHADRAVRRQARARTSDAASATVTRQMSEAVD
jgi:hypothetical protein